jgi:RNA polymerase sigma factor (sigma-70 family)
VRSIAWELKQSQVPLLDLDDAVGDGNIGLIKASKTYDSNNPEGASFNTFAYLHVKGAMLAGYRRYYGSDFQKPSSLNPYDRSLETPVVEGTDEVTLGGTLPDTCFMAPEDAITLVDIEHAMGKLTSRQRSVINLFIQGYTDDEMAYIFGEEPETIRRRFHTAVAKVRRLANLYPENIAGSKHRYKKF